MKRYSSSKKIIRGWKRRVRHLDRWGELIKQPYTRYFLTERGRHTYERYTVSLFYNLEKRHPPLWFYKLMLAKFIAAYSEWEKAFNKLEVPFDLQLWLYDPAYICTEIICYKMKEHGERQRFSWESDLNKSFPYYRFENESYNLHDF